MAITNLHLLTSTETPTILYVRGHFGALPSVAWARLRRVPVAWELNGPIDDALSSWPWLRPILPLLRLSVALQIRMSTVLIAVTPELAERGEMYGARRCVVVSNGADPTRFSPDVQTTVEVPRKYVTFVGALATWQGIPSLLSAVDDDQWPSDVSLVIVGDGVLADHVREVARRDSRVVYLGRLPQRDVAGVLARSLAAVSPVSADQRRGTGVVPLKLFEAMACGIPTIVTDLPGQSDVVRSYGCGLVVAPDDPAQIAHAVATLCADSELRYAMARRARDAAVRDFSWDAAAGKTDDALRDAVDRRTE